MKEVQMAKVNISINNDFDANALSIPQRSNEQGKYYADFNRMMHSQRCIHFYIFLIVSSVTIFVYSLLAYFLKWDELPIVVCESILVVAITIDMAIRIYVTGCRVYFSSCWNFIDSFLIALNFFTIFMYMKFHSTAQEIEDISFALLIFVRNSSQLLRLFVLIRNQQKVAKNVEEIINFNVLYEEKRFEILSMKNKKPSSVISFVDEDEGNKRKTSSGSSVAKYTSFQDDTI